MDRLPQDVLCDPPKADRGKCRILSTSISRRLPIAAIGMAASMAACMAASGCARNYDGTIVPSYTAKMVSDGGLGRMEYRKTDLLPPSRLHDFPSAPPPPASEEPRPEFVRAPPRRGPGRLIPKVPAELPRNIQCRNEQGEGGRVRVVCL
ncbi:hypothetical protein RB623_03775 [Mesorhizobium sp. LHD-90]|uniref:hypothetical protein n=1 Tax=Mesorhizobium sp. LHD-90 TaxID=3071414 RepID=UPI0027E11F40|nr:hypothetical protein [Mesorhizobium sp. LHD-90]MDQ6433167.1 hypothetical protein [Mesorhizobium sp. LHD-90]